MFSFGKSAPTLRLRDQVKKPVYRNEKLGSSGSFSVERIFNSIIFYVDCCHLAGQSTCFPFVVMGWIVAAALFVGLLLFLLLTPLIIEMNTETGKLEVRLQGVARINLVLEEYSLLLRGKALGVRFQNDLLKERRAKEKPKKEKRRKQSRLSAGVLMKKGRAVLRSFSVREFLVDMDTGDFVMNALLYPALHFIDPGHLHLNVNFTGRNELVIKLQNNLLRLGWAVLK